MGHIMLEPKARLVFNRLDVCRTRLKMIDFGESFAEHLSTLPFEEKRKLARHMQKEIGKAHALFEELERVRFFLRAENVATLRGWGKHPDAPATQDALDFYHLTFVELRAGRTKSPRLFRLPG
jgi:hypothetical protein